MNKKISSQFEMEVPFFDVDSYRIVWHGNYAKYFEIARCHLLEKINYSYQTMEGSGYAFPVIDLQVRYRKALKFGQRVRVIATLKAWQNKLVIDYLIKDAATGTTLTKGQTTQVAVSMPDEVTQFQSPQQLLDSVDAAFEALASAAQS
jgi:acyl-CoA thioester hydrolase